jgi:hypothetical protein
MKPLMLAVAVTSALCISSRPAQAQIITGGVGVGFGNLAPYGFGGPVVVQQRPMVMASPMVMAPPVYASPVVPFGTTVYTQRVYSPMIYGGGWGGGWGVGPGFYGPRPMGPRFIGPRPGFRRGWW